MATKNLIIGLGSGRCGTLSLTTIFNAQHAAAFTHERYVRLPWEPIYEYLQLNLSIIMGSQSSAYVGDVAPWYLNYTDAIIQWFPEAKLVCLKRDKEATCKSIIYVSDTLGSNHFVFKNSEYFDYSKYQVDSEEARQFRWCFPKYSMPLEKAVSEYYDEYYKRAEMYQQKYPNNFKIFDTETTLNTEAGQFEVLKWAGFSSSFCLLNLRIFKEFEAHRMGELK